MLIVISWRKRGGNGDRKCFGEWFSQGTRWNAAGKYHLSYYDFSFALLRCAVNAGRAYYRLHAGIGQCHDTAGDEDHLYVCSYSNT